VVCSLNYSASGTEKVLDQIPRMGTNVLIVTPAQSRSIAGRARTGAPVTTIVERDYITIKREVLTRTLSSPLATQSFWSKAGDLSKNATVMACEPDYFAIKDWRVASGALFDGNEDRTAARVAVLGHTVAQDLFGASSPVGRRMMINRVPFTVIGVLRERGQGLDVSTEDNLCAGQNCNATINECRPLVRHFGGDQLVEQHGRGSRQDSVSLGPISPQPAQPTGDFQVQNQKTLFDVQIAASQRLGSFLRWVGASALLVSGLGIVAITWIAVRERTREIGTRRALGATSADIFLQMQFENGVLSLSGGLLGIVLAWPVSLLLSTRVGLPFVFDGKGALLVFAFAAALNLILSLLSSRMAALISPIEALRYE
jgi:putative ABC transport system permease protein